MNIAYIALFFIGLMIWLFWDEIEAYQLRKARELHAECVCAMNKCYEAMKAGDEACGELSNIYDEFSKRQAQ